MTDEQIEAFAAAVVSDNPTVQFALDALIIAVALADETPTVYPRNIWRDDNSRWKQRHLIRYLLHNADVFQEITQLVVHAMSHDTPVDPKELRDVWNKFSVKVNFN